MKFLLVNPKLAIRVCWMLFVVSIAMPALGQIFKRAVVYSSGGQFTRSIAVMDLNGDGKPDIVVANQDRGTVGVLLGNGDGTYQPVSTYSSGGSPTSVAVGDVNGDGKPDIVVVNRGSNGVADTIGVLLGNGDGSFQPANTYTSGGSGEASVTVADVNMDGKPDVLVASTSGTISVFLGNGDGSFQPVLGYFSGASDISGTAILRNSLVVADVNEDGKPDIVVANSCPGCASGGNVGVLLGNGDGHFQPAITYSPGGYDPLAVAVTDVNGDGRLDVAVLNFCSNTGCANGTASVLLGNGDGTFQPALSYVTGGNGAALGIAVADVNGDGNPDLLIAQRCPSTQCAVGGGAVGVLLGNGDGTFQTPVNYSSGSGVAAESLAVADVNDDGKPDVLVANESQVASSSGVGVLLGLPAKTVTAIFSSTNPSFIQQIITFTATVSSVYGPIPDGQQVAFYKGTSVIGTGTTNGGATTFSTSALMAGIDPIKASYAGTPFFKASSASVSQVVNLYPTTTTISSSPATSTYGQNVTLSASVASNAPGGPTGKVTFTSGTATLGTAALSGGSAFLSTSKLPAGTPSVTAKYSGDTLSAKSLGTTTQTVNQASTTTALSSSVNPSITGQVVKFTAKVSSPTTRPIGSVTFMDGPNVLGSANLVGGSTSLSVSTLTKGSHTITAVYNGTINIIGSTSPPAIQTVN